MGSLSARGHRLNYCQVIGFIVKPGDAATRVFAAGVELASEDPLGAGFALILVQTCYPPTGSCRFLRSIGLSVGRNHEVSISHGAVVALERFVCVCVEHF